MKKRIVSLILTFSILLSIIPLNALTAFAQDTILYGDADGNGKVELLDVNLMERYIEEKEKPVFTSPKPTSTRMAPWTILMCRW